ncbi:transporter [Rhodoferax aquaticus]|uniref:Magnesium transporter CorA n=1 Tax=Rhodoferax aquaticus TaxID=2527691 RepID=A0A515ETA5_9BURK|nr:transporter [Rhodoferax aquaticus]QDL55881.1 magnesium transporter CorA [Rhodoferax aquaticus]
MANNTPNPTYGADTSGLIYGFQFNPDGHAVALDAAAALRWLNSEQVASQGGFVWLHFNMAHASTEKWLRENLQLSGVFHESLKDGSRSTRVELDDDTLVAVVNDVHYDFAFEPSDISTLWLSVGRNLVVSARLQPLRSIDRLRDAVRKGATVRSSVALLVHLMHDQGDVLVDIVRGTTARVDGIEDKLLAGRLETKRADLGSLRRLLVRLQRLLAPEPAALFRLLRKPPAWIQEEDLEDLRQSTEEFNVALSDMAALQERIKLLQEEIAGRVAEANNRSLFVLTIVTVLALPINIIAGLLGMNVGGVPFNEHPHGFWIVIAIIVTFTAIAAWIAFRKTKE